MNTLRANQLPPDHPQSDLKAVTVGKGCERGEDDDGEGELHSQNFTGSFFQFL
jgi:hypothetical protein